MVRAISSTDGWCAECNCHHVAEVPISKGFRHARSCPKLSPEVLPVLLIGNAGTGAGSRIKGHCRRGGSKMRKEHSRYCPVGITDEYRTSKICIFCFRQLVSARSRRIVGGKIKTVKVHGALECENTECESYKFGYTIKPRDPHAAAAIAISGAHILFEHIALPPFSRSVNDSTTNNASSNALETLPLLASIEIPQEISCDSRDYGKFKANVLFI